MLALEHQDIWGTWPVGHLSVRQDGKMWRRLRGGEDAAVANLVSLAGSDARYVGVKGGEAQVPGNLIQLKSGRNSEAAQQHRSDPGKVGGELVFPILQEGADVLTFPSINSIATLRLRGPVNQSISILENMLRFII